MRVCNTHASAFGASSAFEVHTVIENVDDSAMEWSVNLKKYRLAKSLGSLNFSESMIKFFFSSNIQISNILFSKVLFIDRNLIMQ